jgi:Bacterial pre-peptidase C-terminal domain.
VQLIRDANNNGLIDANEAFFSREGSGVNTPARINQDLPAGTYFIRVDPRFGSTNFSTSYEMTVVATPYGGNGLPDPGNTLLTARNLGVLSGTTSLKEYVGVLDSDDFYRFTLSSAANLQARLTNSSDITSDLVLIRDTNNNGLIDNGETIASAITSGSPDTTLLTRDLQAGSYFIRVKPRFIGNFSTNYQLDLTTT